ncbi:MAG: response regulator transcription factor [Dehalococcoidia bacterium]|jgi:DNA-binding response OmpR family regulator
MKKVLVVDDEPTLVATLKYNLEGEGYEVLTADNGESALLVARSKRPDLVVLDLMLPIMDGLGVCRLIRREMTVPILILTAKTEEVDKVVGLELGADDYVTKPFSMRELLARVRALLRRSETVSEDVAEVVISGDLELNPRSRVVSRDGKALPLRPKEYDLLAFLMFNRRHVFSREQLLDRVWGYEDVGETRTVDVHVTWLRQKIENKPAKPTRLITVRGTGYRFDG